MALLSDRAGKTSQVVVLPASLEDPSKSPPGMYRLGLLIACGSILAFFVALVVAFYWRSRTPPFWAPITLPRTLWLSTAIILSSSVTFESARRAYRRRRAEALANGSLGPRFVFGGRSRWGLPVPSFALGDGRRGCRGNLETGALGGRSRGVSGFPCGFDFCF